MKSSKNVDFKTSKTAQNLLKAFAGESQARNRYTFYSSVAKKEGYVQISNLFTETANNEKEHAERFFSFLIQDFYGEALLITADYPIGLGDTLTNLKYSAEGEHEEHSNLYPAFADIAAEEGFAEVAACFRNIAKVEAHHEKRFLKLHENIEKNMVFSSETETEWKCENCGYVHTGKSAPDKCPACLHEKSYFEINCTNY